MDPSGRKLFDPEARRRGCEETIEGYNSCIDREKECRRNGGRCREGGTSVSGEWDVIAAQGAGAALLGLELLSPFKFAIEKGGWKAAVPFMKAAGWSYFWITALAGSLFLVYPRTRIGVSCSENFYSCLKKVPHCTD